MQKFRLNNLSNFPILGNDVFFCDVKVYFWDFESYPQKMSTNYRVFNIGNYRIYKESQDSLFVKPRQFIRKMSKIARQFIRG